MTLYEVANTWGRQLQFLTHLLVVAAILLTGVGKAKADGFGGFGGLNAAVSISTGVIVASSAIPVVGNLVNTSRGTEPMPGWWVTGFAVGFIDLVCGLPWIDEGDWRPISLVSIGAVNIGASILNRAEFDGVRTSR